MVNGSTPALARLNSDSTALFGINVSQPFIQEFQNGGLVGSTTPLNLESTGTLKYFAVTDVDSSNRLALLIRDDGGAMQLVRIRLDFTSPAPTPTPTTQPPSSSPGGGIIDTPNGRGPGSETPNEQGIGGPPSDASISTIVPAVVIPVVVVVAGLIILLVMLRRRKKGKGSLLHGKSRVEIAMGMFNENTKTGEC